LISGLTRRIADDTLHRKAICLSLRQEARNGTRELLTQISEIRQQMAASQVFRGYRSVTVGFSGLVAFAAAGLQPLVGADPRAHIVTLPAAVAGRGGGQHRRHRGGR
jgi:hypothetical protein